MKDRLFSIIESFGHFARALNFNRLRVPPDTPEKNPQNRSLGWACVSAYGQTLATQLCQLRAVGCTKIYRKKVTVALTLWRELLKLLDRLGAEAAACPPRADLPPEPRPKRN